MYFKQFGLFAFILFFLSLIGLGCTTAEPQVEDEAVQFEGPAFVLFYTDN